MHELLTEITFPVTNQLKNDILHCSINITRSLLSFVFSYRQL